MCSDSPKKMQFAPINWRNQVQNSRSENRWPRPKYTVASIAIFLAAAEWQNLSYAPIAWAYSDMRVITLLGLH
ncbi:hypothetical protein IE4771_PE00227 (plasmid) [Rhizobium etli bv. mimosae str. IE4771]|uniref:Uncharacterized protein n=1 Tax=Rhizobium etli bv. mimosae str. IE4771 TaxID=1432050 RepID=A0A060ICI6_RHIET|nr:hypothetical protein IE4771_PE00227 [Rhizobium sp. IE4771]